MQKSIETQLTEARARAMTATIEIDTTASAPDGSVTIVTSESDARVTYAVTRDVDGNLCCSCPARVICKHVGLCCLTGIAYHVDPLAAAQEARLAAFRKVDGWLADLASKDAAASLAAQMEQYHATVAAWNAAALAETEAHLAKQEAMIEALPLVERSERTLANVTISEEDKLWTLALLPSVLPFLLAGVGMAIVKEREARWQRYQDARRGGYLN